MSTRIKLPSSADAERPVRPRFYGLMKASTVFLAAALLVQGITAGQLLSGGDSQLHHATGPVVTVAMVLQIIAAILVWRADHGSVRYLALSAVLLVLIGVQFVVGGTGNLAVHVPLGVALFGAGAVLAAHVWSARTAD